VKEGVTYAHARQPLCPQGPRVAPAPRRLRFGEWSAPRASRHSHLGLLTDDQLARPVHKNSGRGLPLSGWRHPWPCVLCLSTPLPNPNPLPRGAFSILNTRNESKYWRRLGTANRLISCASRFETELSAGCLLGVVECALRLEELLSRHLSLCHPLVELFQQAHFDETLFSFHQSHTRLAWRA